MIRVRKIAWSESMESNSCYIVYDQRKLSNNKKLIYSIVLLIIKGDTEYQN